MGKTSTEGAMQEVADDNDVVLGIIKSLVSAHRLRILAETSGESRYWLERARARAEARWLAEQVLREAAG